MVFSSNRASPTNATGSTKTDQVSKLYAKVCSPVRPANDVKASVMSEKTPRLAGPAGIAIPKYGAIVSTAFSPTVHNESKYVTSNSIDAK